MSNSSLGSCPATNLSSPPTLTGLTAQPLWRPLWFCCHLNNFVFPGKLICKDMKHFDEIRSVEVNEFRWRTKVFANQVAQDRKRRL